MYAYLFLDKFRLSVTLLLTDRGLSSFPIKYLFRILRFVREIEASTENPKLYTDLTKTTTFFCLCLTKRKHTDCNLYNFHQNISNLF